MSVFAWDPKKALENVRRHRVTFEEVATVDRDPFHVVLPDTLHDPPDKRFIVIGHSVRERLLVVVTSERGPQSRFISARRATKRERHAYQDRR
jgi:uncharacterized DUF497 family protein